MSTCKKCKYFLKKEKQQAGKFQGFTPQPFGQQKTNPVQQGSCHLNPPNISGQFLTVSETDWCGQFKHREAEQPIIDTDDKPTE